MNEIDGRDGYAVLVPAGTKGEQPAPPSREAEIAARLIGQIEKVILGNEFGADDAVAWNKAEDILAAELSPLLAQLQQARQEQDEAKASEQRQYDQSVEATVEMLQLRAALQQAREALTVYGQHQAECAVVYPTYHAGTTCTCGLDAALKAVR